MTKAKNRPIIAAAVGDRVQAMTKEGLKTGIILRLDDTTFPGKVLVKGDDNVVYEVEVGIGWLD